MATITTRSGKGSPLTNAEVDANFTGLNNDKVERSGSTMSGTLTNSAPFVVTQPDSAGNITPAADNIRVSGYGIIGNRGTFYVTNPGQVQIGVGSSHNADPALVADASKVDSHHNLYAPIMYDRNSTGYYANPASTSRVNAVHFNQLYSSGHSFEKIDLTNGNAHCLGSESYYNTYGPFSGGWNSGTVGHKFYSHNGTTIANIGTGGSSVNLTSRFYGRTDFDLGITAQTLDIGVTGDRTIQALSSDRAFGSYGDLHLNHYGGNVHAVQDKFSFSTSGVGQASGSWRAPIFYDSANTAFYWNPNDNNAHKFQTPSGYVHIGPMNTSHCHISTDRSNFYFNNEIRVDSGKIGSYNEDLNLNRAQSSTARIRIASGTTYSDQKVVVNGTVQHNGLVMTSGTNVDQLYTHTKSLILSTSWQDTGVQAGMLPGGTYIVQVYAADSGAGGGQYYETYSGVMTWYSGDTNDTSWDEIPLHSAGHADSDRAIYLRTLRTATADTRNMVLQIAGDGNNTAAYTYTFKFRRMI